jgi:hypothetical protein
MRKVVLQEFVSMDGLVAGPNDTVDFIPASTQCDRSVGRAQVALMDSFDTLLPGRVTSGYSAIAHRGRRVIVLTSSETPLANGAMGAAGPLRGRS